ncbi:MAG: hypothetical protein Fues2KO_04690 [Fuerstiella sp.]
MQKILIRLIVTGSLFLGGQTSAFAQFGEGVFGGKPAASPTAISGRILPAPDYPDVAGTEVVLARGGRYLESRIVGEDGQFELKGPDDGESFNLIVIPALESKPASFRRVRHAEILEIELAPSLQYAVTQAAGERKEAGRLYEIYFNAFQEARDLLRNSPEILKRLLQLQGSLLAEADERKLVIPAYFNPSTQPNDWQTLLEVAGRIGPDNLVVIINIASGQPFQVGPQPEYSEVTRVLAARRIPWIGYLDAKRGAAPVMELEQNMLAYSKYPGCRGIFVDVLPQSTTRLLTDFMQKAHQHLRRDRQSIVMGNPGTQCDESLGGPTMFPWLCVCETFLPQASFQRPNWASMASEQKLGMLVHSVTPQDAAAREQLVASFVAQNGDFLLLTDEYGSKWNRMPHPDLLKQQVDALNQWNASIRSLNQLFRRMRR